MASACHHGDKRVRRAPESKFGALTVLREDCATVHHEIAMFAGNDVRRAYLSDTKVLETAMAQRLRKPGSGSDNHRRFPPEAEGDFDVVSEREIAEWRAKLEERFAIGKGKLKAIEEPV